MRGFLYRLAIAMKDAGERRGFTSLIRLGLALKSLSAGLAALRDVLEREII
jgi:hypothetical protein